MTKIKYIITKNELRDNFIEEIPERITNGNVLGYSEWLEEIIVDKNFIKENINTRSFDPDYCEVDCEYYELEQGIEDNDEICHLGIGINNCSHCYKNKSLYNEIKY